MGYAGVLAKGEFRAMLAVWNLFGQIREQGGHPGFTVFPMPSKGARQKSARR